jgi:hypothetical protein
MTHEKELPRLLVYVAFGIGIGIAFEMGIAIRGQFDSDLDTDFDPGAWLYQRHFRSSRSPGQMNCVMPGIAMEGVGTDPHSYFSGVRSSLEFIACSQVIFLPV